MGGGEGGGRLKERLGGGDVGGGIVKTPEDSKE